MKNPLPAQNHLSIEIRINIPLETLNGADPERVAEILKACEKLVLAGKELEEELLQE